jgi:hypothetical protein
MLFNYKTYLMPNRWEEWLVRIWKEEIMVYVKVLSWHLSALRKILDYDRQ